MPPADGVRRYLPAAQAAHDVAPVLEPVLVMDPAAQVVHVLCPAEDVYVPAAQSVAPRQLADVLAVQEVV